MTKEEILQTLIPIIEDSLNVKPAQIVPEANFRDDLSADSLDQVELMMLIEKKFEISFTDSELEKVATVQDAIDLIHGRA